MWMLNTLGWILPIICWFSSVWLEGNIKFDACVAVELVVLGRWKYHLCMLVCKIVLCNKWRVCWTYAEPVYCILIHLGGCCIRAKSIHKLQFGGGIDALFHLAWTLHAGSICYGFSLVLIIKTYDCACIVILNGPHSLDDRLIEEFPFAIWPHLVVQFCKRWCRSYGYCVLKVYDVALVTRMWSLLMALCVLEVH